MRARPPARRRRPGRLPRPWRVALAIVCAAIALLGAAGASGQAPGGAPSPPQAIRSKDPLGPGPGERTAPPPPSDPATLAAGRELYAASCSSCHGFDLRGRPGIAPSLVGVGAGAADFYLSTGRMPLQNPHLEPARSRPAFDAAEIRRLVAYVSSFGGPAAPTADPALGSLSYGFRVFTEKCGGCHQVVARGGLTVGARVPSLQSATPQQIAEAVRTGPYLMPRFDSHQIDQYALDSLASYVVWTRAPADRGGWGIDNLGPVPEGIVTWLAAIVALLLVVRLIGERAET